MYVTIWTSVGAMRVALSPNATIKDLKKALIANLYYIPNRLEISYGGRYVRDDVMVARFPAETLVAEGPRYSQHDLMMMRQQEALEEKRQRQLEEQAMLRQQAARRRHADPTNDVFGSLFSVPPNAHSNVTARSAPEDDDGDDTHEDEDAYIPTDIFGNPLHAFGAPRPRSRATNQQLQQAHHQRQRQARLLHQQAEKDRLHREAQQQRAEREAAIIQMDADREKLRQQQKAIRDQQEALAMAERDLLVRMEGEARKLKLQEAEEVRARAAAAKAAAMVAKAEALSKKKAYEMAVQREAERRRVALEEAARAATMNSGDDAVEDDDDDFKTCFDENESDNELRVPQPTTESFAPFSREQSAVIVTPHLQRVGLDATFHRPQCEQPSPASSACSTPRGVPEREEAHQFVPSCTSRTEPTSRHNDSPSDDNASLGSSSEDTFTSPLRGPAITVKAIFPELDGKEVLVTIGQDSLVSELISVVKEAEPGVTKQGVRIMFCEKYIRTRDDDTVRAIPLSNGSTIDVCTGKFLSENEMTLFLADRRLREVQCAMAAHDQNTVDRNVRAHWNEILMKALMLLDSLQEVPEDIRLRRKAGVKAVMVEQDRILEMK